MIEKVKILNMYFGDDIVNSIFMSGLDSLVIIDTGIREKKELLLDEISKYNFVKLFIIITHAHPDHIGNNYALKDKYNPIFISNACSINLLEDYEYQFSKIVSQVRKYFKIDNSIKDSYFSLLDKEVKIDISFCDKMRIDLGNRDLHLIHLPGHTIGDLGIMDKENKILILSELIFKHSRNMIIHIQDYQKYLDSLNIIEKLVSENNLEMLITSHEEKPIKGQDNIFRAIKYNREYIKKIKKEVDNLYKENNSIRDTAREICRLYSKSYTFDSVITTKALLKDTNN